MNKLLKVILLASQKPSNIGLKDGLLVYFGDNAKHVGNAPGGSYTNQELYLVSDEEIKEGDWYYNSITNIVHKCQIIKDCTVVSNGINLLPYTHHVSDCKKIIATTDKSLLFTRPEDYDRRGAAYEAKYQLPQIPVSFIKAYIEAQGNIKEVLVEYEDNLDTKQKWELAKWRLKLREDNTVIIHEAKKYSREEVLNILSNYRLDNASENLGTHNKWIEQNL